MVGSEIFLLLRMWNHKTESFPEHETLKAGESRHPGADSKASPETEDPQYGDLGQVPRWIPGVR